MVRTVPNDRKCCKCGSTKTYVDNSGRKVWIKYRGESHKDEWDRKSWLCNNCYHKILNDLPESYKNIRKLMVKSRSKNLEVYTETGKGIVGECVVANVLEIRNCRNCDLIKSYDFHSPYDLEHRSPIIHVNYGKIDVKTAKLIENPKDHYKWTFHTQGKIDCDYYFCIGFDRYWDVIEVVYIIPNDTNIVKSSDIGIYKYLDPSRGSKWERFKLKDIDIIAYKEAYKSLDIENCSIFKNKKDHKER